MPRRDCILDVPPKALTHGRQPARIGFGWPCGRALRCLGLVLCVTGLGGCIAGGANDSHAYLYQAQHYDEYLAPSVRKASAPLSPGGRVREGRPLLWRFAQAAVVPQTSHVKHYTVAGDSQVAFFNQAISLRQGESEVLAEALPRVFNYGDLEVARHTVGKERIWLLLARSRQSTSMFWLGLYDARGKPLYRAVLPFHKVWSLDPCEDGIQINGSAYAERVHL